MSKSSLDKIAVQNSSRCIHENIYEIHVRKDEVEAENTTYAYDNMPRVHSMRCEMVAKHQLAITRTVIWEQKSRWVGRDNM